ncbi:MAG: glycosyltransferase family 2 protein [Daejeonella sp.]
MAGYPSVSVVILNWNGLDHLKEFLPSVCGSIYPNLDIIVGDNASTDGSLKFLKENYPRVKVIVNNQNYGFAEGYNKVLSQVESDYFVLLNSDVEVHPDWIRPVIRLMENDPLIAAAQPKILSYKNKNNFEYAGAAGGFVDALGYPFCRGRIFDTVESDQGQYDISSEVFWASGAALFIKQAKWLEVGGLDEDFFAHMEEIDLCWRLKNMGYKIMYCAESKVYHVGGGTLNNDSPYKTYLNFKNNLLLLQKNLPFLQAVLTIFVRFWLDFLALIRFLLDGKPSHAKSISKAHFYFFGNVLRNGKKAGLIDKSKFNAAGTYKRSIVWQYFVLQRKTFLSLQKAFES